MEKIILMFTNGLNWFEIAILISGVISVVIGLTKIRNRSTRINGWFILLIGLCYAGMFFVTANGYVSYKIMGLCFAIAFVLNILSWVVLLKFGVKKVFSWLRAYLLGVPIVFVGSVAEQFFGAPTQIAEQYVVLITPLVVELFVVWIEKMPEPGDYTRTEDPVASMTGDESGVDITWMAE